jgi:alkylation response protein AidB-like acyl-CoA dehydrogenase
VIPLELMPAQRELLARVEALLPTFAERAPAYDRSGEFPHANFADLHAAGLLGINIPRRYGGLGADFLTFVLVVERLAQACASTAMAFVMHAAATGTLASDASAEQQERYFAAVVREGKLFSLAYSEPASGQNFLAPQQVAPRVEGGYVFDGVKAFATSAGAADYFLVNARVEAPPDPLRSMNVFVVPCRDNPAVQVRPTWDALGLRATASHELRFVQCFIPEADRIGPHGGALVRMRERPSWTAIGLAAPFVGIAGAAIAYAAEHARTRVLQPANRPLGHFQGIRFLLAEMAMGLSVAQAMLYRAALYCDRDPARATVPVVEAKYVASTQAIAITDRALQVCGGQGYLKRAPVERYYRDARAGALMAMTTEACRDFVGKLLLGMDPAGPE